MLGKLALVPAFSLEPFTGLELADPRANPLHDLRNVRGIAQLNVIALTEPAVGHMCMRVNETRSGGTAVQVDDARLRTSQREDGGVAADRQNAAVADCNGLSN